MKKNLLLILAVIFATSVFGQDIFYTKTGTVIFDASTPIEPIHGENNQVTGFLKTTNGELNFSALIKSFKFKNALMEEHFNENYIESDQYPKAVFKGTIVNFSQVDLSKQQEQEVTVEGDLTLHGITKKITTKAKLHPQNGKITGTAEFIVLVDDFDIKIPSAVKDKITQEVKVTVSMNYEPYNN